MDRGSWRAMVHTVAKSQRWLKWLSIAQHIATDQGTPVTVSSCQKIVERCEMNGPSELPEGIKPAPAWFPISGLQNCDRKMLWFTHFPEMDGITQPQESTVFLLDSTVSSFCNIFPYYILVFYYTMNKKKIKWDKWKTFYKPANSKIASLSRVGLLCLLFVALG